jgi:dienelactone hydrolase
MMPLAHSPKSLPIQEKFVMQSNTFTRSLSKATFVALTITAGFVAASSVGLISAAQAAAPSKLGSLTPFRSIATDIMATLGKGDVVTANKRVTDIESAWDKAASGLKRRDATDWRVLDRAMDHAYDTVRQDKPNLGAAKAAWTEVIAIIDKLDGKPH